MRKIFIGYDEVESAAWHTLVHSLYTYSSEPLSIIPLKLSNLEGIYLRDHDTRQSNSFSFSRFLVPYLCEFSGSAIFMDCDMLVTTDIAAIFAELENKSEAVHVVKHDYIPNNDVKYLGKKQYSYPRKNWSSFIYFNCAHKKNRVLTPEAVRDESAAFLHRFSWLDDAEIGDLSRDWNHLVGEYDMPEILPKNIHWTVGGPYFREFKDADYAELWKSSFEQMKFVKDGVTND